MSWSKKMRGSRVLWIAGLALAVAVAAAASAVASSGSHARKAGSIDVAVLLPDSKSSVRWETQDRRFLGSAFKAAGVRASITISITMEAAL